MTVYLDFETKSCCDLIARGAYNYALDGSTAVLCMAYAIDDGPVELWLPGMPLPDFGEHQIRAHNAAFERLILSYVLEQDYSLEQFYCTAAQARANCLPGSLEDVGRAVKSEMKKDRRGAELVRKCCIPPFDQEALPELYEYCRQDVRAMRAVSQSLRQLTPEELADYHINERINDRGVLVDTQLCRAAVRYSAAELADVQEVFHNITGLASVRSPKMRQWVQDRVGPEALKLMVTYKDGKKKMSVDKSVRAALLTLADENPDEVPPDVAEVLMCADDVWASSVAKFGRLANLADDEDFRLRGAFVFNGGSATGRAASYGAQVHNLSRRSVESPVDVRRAMVRGHELVPKYGSRVSDVLRGMLRPSLIAAPGKVFLIADWAGIEARTNPWCSADPQAEEVLDVFHSGRDIYKREAAGIFRCNEADVDKAQRQIGKVAILACGYGGSIGAFAAMGRGYGVVLPETEARRTVAAWRRANQWAVRYWQRLEQAYTRAMRNPGVEFSAGRTTYLYQGDHLWYTLPSGRVLCYPFARLDVDGVSYLKAAWKPKADATEWPRARLWSGLACENITQATANDLLRYALRELEPDGVVLHVHDEIVIECEESIAPVLQQRMERIMCVPPAWAEGLPLAVEAHMATRYGK